MKKNKNNDETWLGPLREVRETLRAELEQNLYRSVEQGWIQTPPADAAVNDLCDAVLSLHEALRPAYLTWRQSGKIDENMSIEGFTVSGIREKLGLVPISVVFTWFDRLKRDPVSARKTLYGMPRRRSGGIISVEPVS